MKKTQITIKDIGKELSISSSTVSRALRDHPDISPETKRRVKALADKLNYQPNSIAQSLKKMQTNTIGVIVPEIKHYFFSSVLNGIEDVTYNAGYSFMVCKSNENYEREVINTRVLAANRVAGFIVSISQTTKNSNHFKNLQNRGVPIVFFDRVCEDMEVSKVTVDDFEGAFKATEYLIKSGYKKIAHLAGPGHLAITKYRLDGYRKAMQKFNLPIKENYVIHGGLYEEDGIIGFRKLYRQIDLPDAIFTVNDPVAIGAFMQMKKYKIRIPETIALVGFCDNPVSSLIEPSLTTVSQPAYEMGSAAAKLLLEEINHKGDFFEPKTQILKTKLIIRQSS